MLIQYGRADVNGKRYVGNTPLHDATIAGHVNIVRILIDSKADVNATNNFNETALHYAVENSKDGNLNDRILMIMVC